MKKNICSTDRIIRLLLVIVVAILCFTHVISGVVATALSIVAAILAITAFTGFCPLYYVLGIATKKKFRQQ